MGRRLAVARVWHRSVRQRYRSRRGGPRWLCGWHCSLCWPGLWCSRSRPRFAGDRAPLTCYYQPKINASDESVHSVEALVRWRHPTRGLLLPDQFLPAAEDAGLMRPLAARVLDMALTQLRSWRDEGVMLTVAVNVSTTNLLDLGLVASIARLLRTHDLPPESLIPEITESTLTTDPQRARNTVAALRRLGTRLSLDDYGTGWSSLARLQDLSVDELKLDQVFVARLALDPRSIAIVRSTVALAHSLGADSSPRPKFPLVW